MIVAYTFGQHETITEQLQQAAYTLSQQLYQAKGYLQRMALA